MVRLFALPVVAAFLISSFGSERADAGVINGNFSSGLSGWSVSGNASVVGSQAWLHTQSGLNGNRLAAGLGIDLGGLNINHGSVLSQSLTLRQGDKLSFDWNFFTDELTGRGSNRDDIAFWGLIDDQTGVQVLASAFQSSPLSLSTSAFGSETGLTSFVSQTLSAGSYLLVFGVANVGNNRNHSALLIDNVAVTSALSAVVPATTQLGGLAPITAGPVAGGFFPPSGSLGSDPLVQQTIVNPEPASIAVWGLGLIGVAIGSVRRRRRAASVQPRVA